MKKVVSLFLAVVMILSLSACGEKNKSSNKNIPTQSEAFTAPENYASVLLVTINPQFKLYLDENNNVLAVEPVNDDAKTFSSDIDFQDKSVETVVGAIVEKANEKGFVKENATVNFEIVEQKSNGENNDSKSDNNSDDVLKKVVSAAEQKATELNITVTVEAKKSTDNTNASSSEESSKPEVVSSNTTSASKTSSVSKTGSVKPSTSTNKPTESTHTHKYSSATCTEPKKCSCGAVEGKALGHDYKDGVCTRCKAKDPDYKPLTSALQKQGVWESQYLSGKDLYFVTMTICTSDKNSAIVSIGDLLTTLPSEMQNDPEIKNYCKVFNGEYYYIGRGDGDDIKTVKEDNNTVTVTDPSGNNLVLTRTGENTLKCTSAPNTFACGLKISVGSEFTFVAE